MGSFIKHRLATIHEHYFPFWTASPRPSAVLQSSTAFFPSSLPSGNLRPPNDPTQRQWNSGSGGKDLPTPDHRLLDLRNYCCTPGLSLRYSTLDIVAWLRNCPPPSTRHPFPFRPRPSKGLHFLCGYIGSRNASDNYHSSDTVDKPHHHRCLSLILRLPLRSPLTGIIPHHGLAVTS